MNLSAIFFWFKHYFSFGSNWKGCILIICLSFLNEYYIFKIVYAYRRSLRDFINYLGCWLSSCSTFSSLVHWTCYQFHHLFERYYLLLHLPVRARCLLVIAEEWILASLFQSPNTLLFILKDHSNTWSAHFSTLSQISKSSNLISSVSDKVHTAQSTMGTILNFILKQ